MPLDVKTMKIRLNVRDVMREMTTEESIPDKVKNRLRTDGNGAYTYHGMLISLGFATQQEISKPFNGWKKGLPVIYSKIQKSINDLVKKGLVIEGRSGSTKVFWWKP